MNELVELGIISSIVLMFAGLLKDVQAYITASLIIVIAVTVLGFAGAIKSMFTDGEGEITRGSIIFLIISILLIIVAIIVCCTVLPGHEFFGVTFTGTTAVISALILAHVAEKIIGIPMGIVGLFVEE